MFGRTGRIGALAFDHRRKRVAPGIDDRGKQLLLGFEDLVDRLFRHARAAGYSVHIGRAVPHFDEHMLGCGDKALTARNVVEQSRTTSGGRPPELFDR
jgi:hypothetical protein